MNFNHRGQGSAGRAVNHLTFRPEEWGYTDLDSSGRPSLRPGTPGGSEEPIAITEHTVRIA